MVAPIVKTSTGSDEVNVINALKLAFVADPATRWVMARSREVSFLLS
jgi:hypothetical protein